MHKKTAPLFVHYGEPEKSKNLSHLMLTFSHLYGHKNNA